MLLLFAAALTGSVPQSVPNQPVRPLVQATATVRILSGVRLTLDGEANADAPPPRDSIIHSDSGSQPARLIEFQ